MTFQEFAQRKVLGVPVLYLAGAAVVILAVVAYRMKGSPAAPEEESPLDGGTDAELDENGHADGTNPYGGFATNGTVIVQPSMPPADDPEDSRPGSNEEWVRQGAEWLVAAKKVNGQAAYVALNKYINSQSRSFTESGWVDMVIAEKGLPPEPFTGTGPTTSNTPPPATKPPVALNRVSGLKVVKKGATYVNLDWNPASGAKGYKLYANGRQKGNSVLYSAGSVGGLNKNTSYTLGVAAIYAGDKMGPTTTISVRTNK